MSEGKEKGIKINISGNIGIGYLISGTYKLNIYPIYHIRLRNLDKFLRGSDNIK